MTQLNVIRLVQWHITNKNELIIKKSLHQLQNSQPCVVYLLQLFSVIDTFTNLMSVMRSLTKICMKKYIYNFQWDSSNWEQRTWFANCRNPFMVLNKYRINGLPNYLLLLRIQHIHHPRQIIFYSPKPRMIPLQSSSSMLTIFSLRVMRSQGSLQ